MKNVKVAKKSNPHRKPFSLPKSKGKQTRKGGKGTSLMHHAAKKQSVSEAAESNMAPTYETPAKPAANRADAELARLQKGEGGMA